MGSVHPERSAYTAFCAGLLFPLHEAIKGHTSVAVRRQMEQTQWWPAPRILAKTVQGPTAFSVVS